MIRGLLMAAAVMGCTGAQAATFGPQGVEDRLLVAFQPGVDLQTQKQLLLAKGLTVLGEIPLLRVLLAQAPSGASRPAAIGLRADRRIFKVEHDFWTKWIEAAPAPAFSQTAMPSVEGVLKTLPKLQLRGKQDGTPDAEPSEGEIQWGVHRVNAPAAWASNSGTGVKVGIIDTGIDPNHPDLQGMVDGGYNAVEKDKPWADDHSHGTHVAGIVAGKLDGKGVVGVAPKARLYAIKVLTKEGSGSLFGILDGMMWCVQNGMDVVNMSLGSEQGNSLFEYAVQMVTNAGIPLIAAAGNNGKAVGFPAAYKEAIAVSALCPPGIEEARLCPNTQEGIATFSSRGPEIAFIAPGVKIPSSVLGGEIKAYSGTSMASPHVAGLAALAVAKGAKGPDAVRAALKAAATKLPNMTDSEQGNGLVDAARLK